MTQKLSSSNISVISSISCNAGKLVTPLLNKYSLKAFSVDKVFKVDYPEILNADDTDILFEVSYDFLSVNDVVWTPAFDDNNTFVLSGFEVAYATTAGEPTTWTTKSAEACPFNGTFNIIKAGTSSSIIKLTTDPGKIPGSEVYVTPSKLGLVDYNHPYRIKTQATLTCTPVIAFSPTVTVNFDTLEIPWVGNEAYTIEVGSGFVKHAYGLQYGNPSFSLSFTTNTGPELNQVIPLLKTNTGNVEYLQLDFGRDVSIITSSSGKFRLYNSSDTLIHTYNVTDAQVTEAAGDIILSVTSYISANVNYYILVDANVLKDRDNLENIAITSKTAITFNTFSPPIYSWNPGNVTATRNNRTVELNYRYSISGVSGSSGTIRFYKGDGTLLKTFTPTGTGVTYAATSPSLPGYPYATTVKFDVRGLIIEDSSYYMLIDAGVFIDADNFSNTAITNTSTLAYSTDDIVFPGFRANILAETGLSDSGRRLRFGRGDLSSVASFNVSLSRFKRFTIALSSSASAVTINTRLRRFTANLTTTASFSCNLTTVRRPQIDLSSSASVVVDAIEFITLTPTTTITNPNYYSGAADDRFGTSSGMTSTYTLIGTPYDSDPATYGGVAHVYQNSTNNRTRTFANPDITSSPAYSGFGGNVFQVSDTALITAFKAGSPSHIKVYAYDVTNGSLKYSVTTFAGSISYGPEDSIVSDGVYFALVTDSNLYLYALSNGALIASTGFSGGNVHISSGKLVHDDGTNVFVWNLSQVSLYGFNTDAALIYTLTSPTNGIAVNTNYLITSAGTQGRYVKIYTLSNGVLANTIDLWPVIAGTATVSSLRCDNSYLLITGALGYGASIVYCYKLSNNQLTYVFNNPNSNTADTNDAFGGRVQISGTRVLITAPDENASGNTDSGIAYVYTLPT